MRAGFRSTRSALAMPISAVRLASRPTSKVGNKNHADRTRSNADALLLTVIGTLCYVQITRGPRRHLPLGAFCQDRSVPGLPGGTLPRGLFYFGAHIWGQRRLSSG